MRNRAQIKQEAKQLIRTGRVSPLVMTAILLVIGFMLERVITYVEYGTLFTYGLDLQYIQALYSGDLYEVGALLSALPEATVLSSFLSILVSLVTLILSAGYYVYCMGIRQGVVMPYSTLFDGLSVAGKLIWCAVLMYIKVFLWSLLFVVPGIVAVYRYRFAYYNLLTDSSLSAGEAIRLSCQQTSGMKWELFVLDLSFIGWSFLSALTMNILSIWLQPYMTLCDLAYFEDAQRSLGRSPYGGTDVPPHTDQPWEF